MRWFGDKIGVNVLTLECSGLSWGWVGIEIGINFVDLELNGEYMELKLHRSGWSWS